MLLWMRPLIQAEVTGRWYRPRLRADFLAVLFMNALKNMSNVVIGELDKLVHKQNCFHDFFYFINYNIILVHDVRYIITETKEVTRIGYNGLLFFAFILRRKRKPVISNTGASFGSIVMYQKTHTASTTRIQHWQNEATKTLLSWRLFLFVWWYITLCCTPRPDRDSNSQYQWW